MSQPGFSALAGRAQLHHWPTRASGGRAGGAAVHNDHTHARQLVIPYLIWQGREVRQSAASDRR
jgi:hypothetical protein